jgi:hypothetical protein
MVSDTPILDDDYYHAAVDCELIQDRLDRAQKFCSYLDKAWKGFPRSIPGAFDWTAHSALLTKSISRIRQSTSNKTPFGRKRT